MGSDETRPETTWERLARRTNDSDAGELHCDGSKWRYVPALLCRRILANVLGPGNWQTKLSYTDGAAVCHLTIDEQGMMTTRAAIGYDYPDLAAADAAFISACEQFGVGQDLVVSDARWIRPRRATTAPAEPARNGHAPRDERPGPPPREERHEDRRDDRRDDRPARDERPRYDDRDRDRDRDRNGNGNGSQREYGDRGPRGPRNGSGYGSGPRPGGHAYKWLKEQEEDGYPGLVDYIAHWLKGRGKSAKISELSQHDLYEIVDEVNDFKRGAGLRR